jgi:hypothetical protein
MYNTQLPKVIDLNMQSVELLKMLFLANTPAIGWLLYKEVSP